MKVRGKIPKATGSKKTHAVLGTKRGTVSFSGIFISWKE